MRIYKKLSIVIPVYNEEAFISKIIDRVIKANTCGLQKELIVIDDGSDDNSVDIIKEIKKKIKNKYPKVEMKAIFKEKNAGKGAALKDGFTKTTGDLVLIQDADLEYSPSEYKCLLEPFFEADADVVYGSRFITTKPRRIIYFSHYIGVVFLTLLSNLLTNLNLSDMWTCYKVFDGKLIRAIAKKLERKRFGFEPEITARISKIKDIKIYEVGISYWGRSYSEGKKITWRDGVRALFTIIRFNLF